MINKIVNPESLKVEFSYTEGEVEQFGEPWASYPHIAVPQGLEPDCVIAQLNGETIELIEDSALVAAKLASMKTADVAAAYKRMCDDIYGQMFLVFGTIQSDSAIATGDTFPLMIESPAYYASEGLIADKECGGFHVGDVLDTDQKVLDYATARYAEIKAYSLYRLKRLLQFRSERAAILA